MARRLAPAAVLLVAVLVVLAYVVWFRSRATGGGSLEQPSFLPSVPVSTAGPSGSPAPEPQILLAVGDVGECDSQADDAVARLARRLPGTIALVGDTVYDSGSAAEYRTCFDPNWGPVRSRIRPAVGNHEYRTEDASGYFGYFGAAAGETGKGWYSYDLGAWHVVVLNSNCDAGIGCGPGSEQYTWLQHDLSAFHGDCLLGYWHHPRWSSGRHGSQEMVQPLWEMLRAHGADVIVNGHDHTYERVEQDGMREFVVGTGGKSHYPFEGGPLPGTEVRNDSTFGLLWLALGDGTYDWDFVGLGDSGFKDSGSGTC